MNRSPKKIITMLFLIASLLSSKVFADGNGPLSQDFINRVEVSGLERFNSTSGLSIETDDIKTFLQFNMEFSTTVKNLIGSDYPYEFELTGGHQGAVGELPWSNGNLSVDFVANNDESYTPICGIASPNSLIGVTCHFNNEYPLFEIEFWDPYTFDFVMNGEAISDRINLGVFYPGMQREFEGTNRNPAMDVVCFGLAHEEQHAIPMLDERFAYIVQYLQTAFKYGLSYTDFISFMGEPQYHPSWGNAPVSRQEVLKLYPSAEFREDIPIKLPTEEDYNFLYQNYLQLVDKYQSYTDGTTGFLDACIDTSHNQ